MPLHELKQVQLQKHFDMTQDSIGHLKKKKKTLHKRFIARRQHWVWMETLQHWKNALYLSMNLALDACNLYTLWVKIQAKIDDKEILIGLTWIWLTWITKYLQMTDTKT